MCGASALHRIGAIALSPSAFLKHVAAPATIASDSGLAGSTTYTYKITSIDQAGNESAMSGAVSQTTQSSGAASYVADIQYNAAGLKTRVEYGNGVVTTYTYDPNLRLKTLITRDVSGNDIQHLTYNYDGVGNVIDITDSITGEVREFFYDALNRLGEARGNYGPGQTYTTLSYAYEANGNIARKDGLDYTYDRTGDKPHAVRAVGEDSFDYDANGNMITRTNAGQTTTYSYDAENRLSQVTADTFTAQYRYDDTGARTLKQTPGVTTAFVGELFEDSGIVTKRYVFVGGTRVAEVANGALAYYHPDHLGSMNVTTNAAGAVADRAEYRPFGEFARHDYPVGEGHYFTDQYRDHDTELYYYGARYYNPKIGRFLTADTIVQRSAHSQSLNRYSYVWNNPVNGTDPTGNIGDFNIGESLRDLGLGNQDYVPITATFSQMLDGLQLGLDGLGMTEPFGFVFDGTNAAISLGRRDYVGAAIDGFAAIPALGLYVRGADLGKTALRAAGSAKSLKNSVNAADAISSAKKITALGSRADTLEAGKKGYNILNIKNWTPDKNIKFIDDVVKRGDAIELVTDPLKHQELMMKIDKPSAFLDLELPRLFDKGFINKGKYMVK